MARSKSFPMAIASLLVLLAACSSKTKVPNDAAASSTATAATELAPTSADAPFSSEAVTTVSTLNTAGATTSPSTNPAPTSAAAGSPDTKPRPLSSSAMNYMLVVDSSGSMWGQISGVAKRDIAREAIKTLTEQQPKLAAAGLIAYGHRKANDCADIEILRPPNATTPSIAELVDKLQPLGKTPMTDAVKEAARVLTIEENRSTIVLVTDGVETCEADPCAVGAELEKAGIDLTVNVVGFDLTASQGEKIRCLAEQTGGRYYDAKDAKSLTEALNEVAVSAEKPPVKAGAATATLSAPDSVEIGSTINVQWTGPAAEFDTVLLTEVGAKDFVDGMSYGFVSGTTKEPIKLQAPGKPGTYELRYSWRAPQGATIIARRPITVTDAKVAIVSPGAVNIGQQIEIPWKGPGGEYDKLIIVTPDAPATTSEGVTLNFVEQGNPLKMQAPGTPGQYEIRYILRANGTDSVLKTAPLQVLDVPVRLSFNPTQIVNSKISIDWQGPEAENDKIEIGLPGGKRLASGEIFNFVKGKNPLELQLPSAPGTYEIRYLLNAPGVEDKVLAQVPVTVTAGTASIKAPSQITTATAFTVTWTGPPGSYNQIRLAKPTDPVDKKVDFFFPEGNTDSRMIAPANAGTYELRYVIAGNGAADEILARQTITVTEAAVSMKPSKTSAKAGEAISIAWAAPEGNYNKISIAERGSSKSEPLFYLEGNTSPTTATMPSKPGAYEIRLILQGPDAEVIKLTVSITIT
jgi:Ca-activated chloride channel homolog